MALLDWIAPEGGLRLEGDGVLLRPPRPSDYLEWRDVRSASRGWLQPWEPVWPLDDLTRAAFRRRLSAGALPELVDPIGIEWLRGDEGWEQRVAALVEGGGGEGEHRDRPREVGRAHVEVEVAERQRHGVPFSTSRGRSRTTGWSSGRPARWW